MEKTAQNQSNTSANKRQMMDFGPAKTDNSTAPVPVTSAKAAINAMFAEQAKAPSSALAPSAREIVNASSKSNQRSKSAANLHHGSIQKSMESTRTSASALLRGAKDDGEKPVVRTSLKLGANARPKQPPVVLPPNARMAQQARPVAEPVEDDKAFAVQIISKPKTMAARPRGPIRDPQMLGSSRRRVVPARPRALDIAQTAQIADTVSSEPVKAVNVVSKTLGSGPNHLAPKRPEGMSARQSARFRTAPKGHVMARPANVPTDDSYVMAEPPKLSARATENIHKEMVELGIDETVTVADALKRQGDKAPIGRVMERAVASGHGGVSENEYNTIKTSNTSNYSFSRRDQTPKVVKKADDGHYKPVDQSVFLKTVSVEKRPLAGGMPTTQIASYGQSDSYQVPGKKDKSSKSNKAGKASRKNVYAKKSAPKSEPKALKSRQDLPSRPTVIIPSSRRSKAPLFFLILLTVILGAAVGAAAYLCFFQ